MQEAIGGKREDGRLSLCRVHVYLGVQDQELVLRKPEGRRLGIKLGEEGSCQTDFRRGQTGRKTHQKGDEHGARCGVPLGGGIWNPLQVAGVFSELKCEKH